MISTKDITSGGGSIPKMIQPGNRVLKINKVYLESVPWNSEAFNLKLECEGPDLGSDFEGFFLDRDNESLGRHNGQVGTIRSHQYAYEDKTLDSGVQISRDLEIVKFLKNLCSALGCDDWLAAQDNKHETIQSLIEQFNEDRPFDDIFLSMCVCGKEYQNKEGYTNYDLFLPKFTKNGIPFESEEVEAGVSRVYKFDEAKHIIKLKSKDVDGFSSDGKVSSGGSEFELS